MNLTKEQLNNLIEELVKAIRNSEVGYDNMDVVEWLKKKANDSNN